MSLFMSLQLSELETFRCEICAADEQTKGPNQAWDDRHVD